MENTQVGPFLIIKRLGTTRRQKVFHARQVEQNRDVALKFIAVPPDVGWAKALDKINREVEVLKQLKHPNLVQAYGAGAADEKVFFANELVKGESLAAILARRGKLAPDLAVEYGKQISHLLEYLHQHEVLHSKLTPDKIIVTKDHKIKVADLRLNRSKRRRWDATKRRELDIAAYMAPEQFTEGATHKSDFYALGVILFEMLSGKLPYPPDTMGRMTRNKLNAPVPSVATHVMNCPIWLDQIVTQMLQPDPKKRPHSARAISFAFDEIKNIDQTQKAAVSQVSGKFNPLNAGKDKTEANRLLGKKVKKKGPEIPFYQTVPFLVACLVLIACVIGIALIPPSPAKLLSKGEQLMESDRLGDWRRARGLLEKVMERSDDPQMVQRAENLYFESKRRTLVQQAEGGGLFLLSQQRNVREFGEAVALQKDGKTDEAAKMFRELADRIEPDGDERYVLTEVRKRLKEIEELESPLPTDTDSLLAIIHEKHPATETQLLKDQRLLSRIIMHFAGEEGYLDVVSAAKNQLKVVEKRIEEKDFEAPATEDSVPPVDDEENASGSSGPDGPQDDFDSDDSIDSE